MAFKGALMSSHCKPADDITNANCLSQVNLYLPTHSKLKLLFTSLRNLEANACRQDEATNIPSLNFFLVMNEEVEEEDELRQMERQNLV